MSCEIQALWTCDRCSVKCRIKPVDAYLARYPKASKGDDERFIELRALEAMLPDGWTKVFVSGADSTHHLCSGCTAKVRAALEKPDVVEKTDWEKP